MSIFTLIESTPVQRFLSVVIFILTGTFLNAQNYPPGFSQSKVATIYYPTAMAFAPDGRIFCTEKGGKVRIVKNGAVIGTFLNVSADQEGEHGLVGIALDPDFSSNHYVYIYYVTSGTPRGRLSRFTANGDNAVAGSEVVLLETSELYSSIHCGGGIAFGPDGKLYLGIGNDNSNSNSQNIHTLKGKVIRINKDGSPASGNPFSGSADAERVWAYGLRNPWTIVVGNGKIFVNDVGQNSWEEVNDCTSGGKNFGWAATEGYHNDPSYSNPVYAYPHGDDGGDEGCSITGGQFFNGSISNYPSQYSGKYFYIDYCGNWINYLDLSSGVTWHTFASGLPSSLNYIRQGTDGNLYYFSIGQNSLYKISYSGGGNNPPVITDQPDNVSVNAGQNATFNVTATGSSPLQYQWQKNNQDIPGANSDAYTIANVQGSDAGAYRVKVSNNYGNVTSSTATLTVNGSNTKPAATIITPAAGTLYRGGDVISFSGDGTDAQDGNLPASAFQWIVTFYHAQHVHPGPYIQPGIKSGSFTISQSGETSADVWYRVHLIVTDSDGASDTAVVDLYPKKSTLTLKTQPEGMQLLFNDQPVTTDHSAEVVSGITHRIGVISPQAFNGSDYTFDHWVHGGNASQEFPAPENNTTYTAVFKNTATGVGESESENFSLNIYPNPVNGSFTIDITTVAAGEMVSYEVISSSGQSVYKKAAAIVSGHKLETIDLSGVSSGVYTVQFLIGQRSKSMRVVVK